MTNRMNINFVISLEGVASVALRAIFSIRYVHPYSSAKNEIMNIQKTCFIHTSRTNEDSNRTDLYINYIQLFKLFGMSHDLQL